MKRHVYRSYVVAAALALMPLGAMAQAARQHIVRPSAQTLTVRGRQVPAVGRLKTAHAATPQAPRKAWGGEQTSDEILDEQFSKFTEGSAEQPDTIALCDEFGSFGGEARWDIDPQYTQTPGWCGTWVFQAGGNAFLNDPTGYSGAMLNSPLGDYSGNLTITLRVKNYGNYTADLNVNMLKGGYESPEFVITGDESKSHTSVNLYPGSGWKTITLKVHNTSADNDGYLQLLSYGQCLVDYVHIEREGNYIAPPKMLPMTQFTDTSFTANWEPVDMAYNYYTWLYQKDEYGTMDRSWTADFEDGVPEGFTATGEILPGAGSDGSNGFMIARGDTLTTPVNLSLYKAMSFWMKVGGATKDALTAANSKIQMDFLTINGWEYYGAYYANYWLEPGEVDLEESTEGEFANRYYGVRFYTEDFPEGAYLVLDDINIAAGKDTKLSPVGESEQYGYYYDDTRKTSFTFSEGLDPQKDYFYGVQSHYSKLTSELNLQPAYGVAAPEAKPATDIDSRGAFTANWAKSVKATGYRVSNYGLYTAKEDGQHSVIDEDFARIDASVTSATDPYSPEEVGSNKYKSLDDYTHLPGWTARNTLIAQGWLGAINDEYTTGIIKTPVLYLDNDDHLYITLKAIGTPGDLLGIYTPAQKYYVAFDQSGKIDDTYTVPERGAALVLRITGDSNFMLDRIAVSQDLRAGDKVYTLLGTAETGRDELSTTFDGLYDYDYDSYAYTVTALRTDGVNQAESDTSDHVLVDLANGTSTLAVLQPTARLTGSETIYTTGGQRANKLQRGLNIVRQADGTVRKIFVK